MKRRSRGQAPPPAAFNPTTPEYERRLHLEQMHTQHTESTELSADRELQQLHQELEKRKRWFWYLIIVMTKQWVHFAEHHSKRCPWSTLNSIQSLEIGSQFHNIFSTYRKFSIKGATPYKGAPLFFDPKAIGFLDVFDHISAKNSPIFIL